MSDKNLENLIQTIKQEAIETADKKAAEILEQAKKEAADIIKSAQSKKAALIDEGEKTAEATINKGENALKQAARDLSITLHNDIKHLFRGVLEQEVDATFTPETIKTAVLKLLEQVGTNVEIQLPEALKKEVVAYIQKQLQHSKSITAISADTALLKGFKITNTNEGWSYQITPEDITGLLHSQLNNQWKEILSSK
jgi:vacuolar-type H+-ATPase subunit E/Vma4